MRTWTFMRPINMITPLFLQRCSSILTRPSYTTKLYTPFLSSLHHHHRLFSTTNDQSNERSEIEEASIWDKEDLGRIFTNNRKWQEEKIRDNPEYFKRLAVGQEPQYLLVSCADSRVGAQEIMGLNQGELFVHRNVANLVVNTDLNFLSVLFYSVNVLKVKDILVVGHYECGGIRAASQNQDLGLIEHWLHNIRDVQRLHKKELYSIADPEKRHRRLVELNVQEQCFNLFCNSIVQQMQAKTGRPRIHGLVYDIENGLLKKLDIDFKSAIREYRNIYTVADFRRYAPVHIQALTKDKTIEEVDEGERQDLARIIFDAIDSDHSGTISREDLRAAIKTYANHEVSETELNEAMKPFLGMDKEQIDLDAFEAIFDIVQHGEHEATETDRLVVIRPSGGQKPPRPLRCHSSTTVHELKEAIETLTGTPVEQQSLTFKGKKLTKNEKTLEELGIHDIAEVELQVEIVPGGFMRP